MTGRVDSAEPPQAHPPGAAGSRAADLDEHPRGVERPPGGRLGAELREQLVDPVLGEHRVDLAGQPGRELGVHAMDEGLLRLPATDPADRVVGRPGPDRASSPAPERMPSWRDTPSNSASAASRSTGRPGAATAPTCSSFCRPCSTIVGQKLCTSVRCQRRSSAAQSGQEGTREASGTPARTSRNRRLFAARTSSKSIMVAHPTDVAGRRRRRGACDGAAAVDARQRPPDPGDRPWGGRSTLGP